MVAFARQFTLEGLNSENINYKRSPFMAIIGRADMKLLVACLQTVLAICVLVDAGVLHLF